VALRPRRLLAASRVRGVELGAVPRGDRKIVSQEEGHQYHGQNNRGAADPQEKDREKVQRIFEEWLRQGLICLGRPDSEGNSYAVSVGLKKRDSADCIKDYMKDILPPSAKPGSSCRRRSGSASSFPPTSMAARLINEASSPAPFSKRFPCRSGVLRDASRSPKSA
jgi:hypothetical protein